MLQVASWTGNIGDSANHAGASAMLEANTQYQFDITRFEIREVYWGVRRFDSEFVSLCNAHDLVVFGGGNYFELWVEKSSTGCSIDLSKAQLDDIRPPILFYSLGCDRFQGVPDICRDRFGSFLQNLLARENCFVSVRNDGSYGTIEKLYGTETALKLTVVPDGGFFFRPAAQKHAEIEDCTTSIAVNLAGDMLSARFPGGDLHDPNGFLAEFSSALADATSSLPGSCIVLVPHIASDIEVIARFLGALPDKVIRKSVRVAPLLLGLAGATKIFDLYRQSDIVLGMRFHANVCPIGMGQHTIGLGCYGQVFELYAELGLKEKCHDVRTPGFGKALTRRIVESTTASAVALTPPTNVVDELESSIKTAHRHIARWFQRTKL